MQMMQMERKIQEEIFHLLQKKIDVSDYTSKFPFFLEASTFLRSISMKDVISLTIKLIFKHIPLILRLVLFSGNVSILHHFPIIEQWMSFLSAFSNACCGLSKYSHSHNNFPCSNDMTLHFYNPTNPCFIVYLKHGHKSHWRLWTKSVSGDVLDRKALC